jgi:hypothetical protein
MTQADRVLSTPPINTPVDPRRRFETLKDAEDNLREQGFKLVPDTCNWIDDAGRIDAGVYPDGEAYRIEYREATPSRRRFLTVAAVASIASVGALTAAAMAPPIPAAVTRPARRGAIRALDGAHQHDPVFGLIEAHRRANAAHESDLDEQTRLERLGDPVADSLGEQSCHAAFAAFDELLSGVATTVPGIVAQLAYLQDIATREAWMFTDRDDAAINLLKGFAASIANVAVTS